MGAFYIEAVRMGITFIGRPYSCTSSFIGLVDSYFLNFVLKYIRNPFFRKRHLMNY